MNSHPKIWGVLPAAGIGVRMGSDIPKQYLLVQQRSILEHSLQCLLAHPRVCKVAIALAKDDQHWPTIQPRIAAASILTVAGGTERSHSVYAGLLALADIAHPQDWVLVHDAVRPCVQLPDIDRLINTIEQQQAVGGLLALPVRDTLKIVAANGAVTGTVDRNGIWQAQTPQMFRLAQLTQALGQAIQSAQPITDEANAMELYGQQPLVVPGSTNNIKVTQPEDLFWVRRYLQEENTTCV